MSPKFLLLLFFLFFFRLFCRLHLPVRVSFQRLHAVPFLCRPSAFCYLFHVVILYYYLVFFGVLILRFSVQPPSFYILRLGKELWFWEFYYFTSSQITGFLGKNWRDCLSSKGILANDRVAFYAVMQGHIQ